MNNKLWIIFEGIDGSGKTTQAKLLNEFLTINGYKSVYKHIFDTKIGMEIRDIFINNELSNLTEILLLCATREIYINELMKETQENDVIITDRLFWSILTMQGKTKTEIELIDTIQKIILKDSETFITYYMNTFPDECIRRLRSKGINDRIERKNVEFHKTIYENYSRLIKKNKNLYIFDGNDSIKCIHQQIIEVTKSHLLQLKTKGGLND